MHVACAMSRFRSSVMRHSTSPVVRPRCITTPVALAAYTETCLRRVWRAQHFSYWMTTMLHRFPTDDAVQRKLQIAQLRWVVSSRAAATSLAENYTGIVAV